MNRYLPWLFIVLAAVVYLTTKSATATDAKSQPVASAKDVYHEKEIPIGFKLERYAGVWERNPFILVTVDAPKAQHSPFEKLFLTSWLKDGRSDVIFIQNLETNEVQKITAEPNQSNLRLIALHLDATPQLVEAVISDGKEQGSVKFRLDVQTTGGQTAPPVAQAATNPVTRHVSSVAQVPSRAMPGAPANSSSTAGTLASASEQANQPMAPSMNPGVPGDQTGLKQAVKRRQESEGMRLPPPGQ